MCDLNNITYSRNTGMEDKVFYEMNKTQSFIRAALSDVSLPPRVPKAEYYQTVYKPFLLKTTEEMNRLTTSYKFNLSAEGQPMFTGVSPTGFAQKAYVINIICYGKSLMYILKYIAFWFLKMQSRISVQHIHIVFLRFRKLPQLCDRTAHCAPK